MNGWMGWVRKSYEKLDKKKYIYIWNLLLHSVGKFRSYNNSPLWKGLSCDWVNCQQTQKAKREGIKRISGSKMAPINNSITCQPIEIALRAIHFPVFSFQFSYLSMNLANFSACNLRHTRNISFFLRCWFSFFAAVSWAVSMIKFQFYMNPWCVCERKIECMSVHYNFAVVFRG